MVVGGFDNFRSREVRFLEEASKLGQVHVYLLSDDVIEALSGAGPDFPQEERKYLLNAVRYVNSVRIVDEVPRHDELPPCKGFLPDIWAVTEASDTAQKQDYCRFHGISYAVIQDAELKKFTQPSLVKPPSLPSKKVLVTGCYDWFHSGHIRFFEETSEYGDLYVVVGSDANVALLKGAGHPMFPEDERRYMVSSIRFVKQALISTGSGWMDAEPEIEMIQPEIYAVNEDGDKPEKLEFCNQHGLDYVVLKRSPAAGLPRRESTYLRGFFGDALYYAVIMAGGSGTRLWPLSNRRNIFRWGVEK